MSGEKISHALGHISDAALESAMDVYKRKQRHRSILRTAAIAAVIAILMTALFLLDGSNSPAPYFSVYVYASETDTVEVLLDKSPIVSNYDPTKDPTYRPIFDSTIGTSNPSSFLANRFVLYVSLDDHTKNYENLEIFFDGEKVEQSIDKVFTSYRSHSPNSTEDKKSTITIFGKVEIPTKVDLILYNNSGKMLQCYTMNVTPLEDGGYTIMLEKAYVGADGTNIFSRIQ